MDSGKDGMEKHTAKMKQLALSPIKAELERSSLRRMFGLFYEEEAAKRLADLVISVKFDLPRRKKFTGEGGHPDAIGTCPGRRLAGWNERRYLRRSAERRYGCAGWRRGNIRRDSGQQHGSRIHRDPAQAQGNIRAPGEIRADAPEEPSGQSQSKPVKPE